MRFFRRRAALARACTFVSRHSAPAVCEELEPRKLLAANDPVIVFNETLSLTARSEVTKAILAPYLWHNPDEAVFDLDTGPSSTVDGDGNGLVDDVYGWNFIGAGSPSFVDNTASGHNSFTALAAIDGIRDVESVDTSLSTDLAPHIKIMYVTGSYAVNSAGVKSPALQYVMDKKNAFLNGQPGGANIIAVAHGRFSADVAKVLQTKYILDFDFSGNVISLGNKDGEVGTNSSSDVLQGFDRATPSKYIQEPPVESIIPTTILPLENEDHTLNTHTLSGFGINSYYFAVRGQDSTSFTVGKSAVYAAAAVASYQANHSGATPGWEEVKRALMSGVRFDDAHMDNPPRTITHDFDSNGRKGGGVIDQAALPSVYTAINTTTPAVSSISITPTLTDLFGTEVQLLLAASGSVSNWTVNWGDNTSSEVAAAQPTGATPLTHTYDTSTVHHYFPTAYAVSANNGQVYLASAAVEAAAQAQVVVNAFSGTSIKDEYTLTRDGDDVTLTVANSTVTTFSSTFEAGAVPSLPLILGAGGDTATIDFSGGDPLEGMTSPSITATTGAGGVTIIGRTIADTITVGAPGSTTRTITVNSYTPFTVSNNASLTVEGGGGNDTISGSSAGAPLWLQGDGGNDVLTGGSGDDTLIAGLGDDSLNGGAGHDIANYNGSSVSVDISGDASSAIENEYVSSSSTDTLTSIDEVIGSDHADEIVVTGMTVRGGGGDDYINGSASVEGGAGDDFILAPSGQSSTIFGNEGDDQVSAGSPTSHDSIDGGAGADQISGAGTLLGGAGADQISGAGTLLGGAGNDTLTGGGGNDFIHGGSGDLLNDTISGGAGNDSIDGGAGADTLYGGKGLDTINGGDGNDTIVGGPEASPGMVESGNVLNGDGGNDGIRGAYRGEDTISGGDGNDSIQGGFGRDSMSGDGGNDTLVSDAEFGLAYLQDDADTLVGGDGNDYLRTDSDGDGAISNVFDGGAVNDTITAGGGDDSIAGGANNDSISGGTGDDVIHPGTGNDTVDGGDGIDTADYSERTDGMALWLDNLANDGGTGETANIKDTIEVLIGGSGDDYMYADAGPVTMIGNDGGDWLVAQFGDNSLVGGDGDDSITGSSGSDTVEAGAGNDTVYAGAGNDTIIGGTGDDNLYGEDDGDDIDGGTGDDLIYGGAGGDLIYAGDGSDTIYGGDDDDLFGIYGDGAADSVNGGSGYDITTDYDIGMDTLDGIEAHP